MNIISVKKLENCFANAKSFSYVLDAKIDESFLSALKELGEMEIKRELRRPFFFLDTPDGIKLKGVLGSKVLKVGYPENDWEPKKAFLEDKLKAFSDTILAHTTSVCPICLEKIPAKKIRHDGKIYLDKTCKEHGKFKTLIWTEPPTWESFYREKSAVSPINPKNKAEHGCPDDCGLCSDHRQKTCCVLLEVTQRCSLVCPVCYASSGKAAPKDPDMDELRKRFELMLHFGGPFNVQLSGGEPCERDDLPDIIRLGRSMGFSFFQLNTNGLRIASDRHYLEELAEAGLSCVFLQFDGFNKNTYETLRGRMLLDEKLKAIEACAAAKVGVVLVPVIARGVNDSEIGDIIRFAIDHMPEVRGVHFQPMSYFGRNPGDAYSERFTLADLLKCIEKQTDGLMKMDDFSPGNAENPFCSFSGNFILDEDGLLKPWRQGQTCGCGSSACAEDASDRARLFVAKQWSSPKNSCCGEQTDDSCCCEQTDDSCCCEQTDSGCCGEQAVNSCCGEQADTSQACCDTEGFDEFINRAETYTLSVSAMGFMDAWNFDTDRIKECYIHVVTGDGLIPFCAYNLTSVSGETKYRGKN